MRNVMLLKNQPNLFENNWQLSVVSWQLTTFNGKALLNALASNGSYCKLQAANCQLKKPV